MRNEEEKTEKLDGGKEVDSTALDPEGNEQPKRGIAVKTNGKIIVAISILAVAALVAIGIALGSGALNAEAPDIKPATPQKEEANQGRLTLEVAAEGWPEDGEPFGIKVSSETAGGEPLIVEVKPDAEEAVELEAGEYVVSVDSIPVLEGGSTWAVPEAQEIKVESGEEESVFFDLKKLDIADAEAVEEAIAGLPEEEREAARQQYQKKTEESQVAPNGPSGSNQSNGSAAPNSSGSGGSGSSDSGAGGGTGSGGGTSEQPETPAACNHSWVEQGGYQDVWVSKWETVTITEYKCNGCAAVFDSLAAAEAHGREMAKAGTPHGGYSGGSYSNEVDNGGWQSTWVGNGTYVCSKCGARK